MEAESSLLCWQEAALDATLSQLNPVHILTSHFFRIYFNIILLSSSIYPLEFQTKILYAILISYVVHISSTLVWSD
jgi:hypothetical protein